MRGSCSALQHRDQLLPKPMAADRDGILSMASHVKVNIRPVLTFLGLLIHDRLLQNCWGLNLKNKFGAEVHSQGKSAVKWILTFY